MPGFQPQAGHKFKFYRNTGTAGTPVWSLLAEIGDLSIDSLVMGIAELKRRANIWTKALPTLIQLGTVSFRMHFGLDATNHAAVRADWLAGTIREYAILSGLVDYDSQGWRVPLVITDFPWDQNLEDVSGHDAKAAFAYYESPAGTEVDPSWMTVTSTTSA